MYIYIYIYIYIPNLYTFFLNVLHKIKQKDIHKLLVIFQLFTNLLWTSLNRKCKIVFVIKIVIK